MSDKGKKNKKPFCYFTWKSPIALFTGHTLTKTQWDDDKGRLTKGYKTEMKPYFHLVHKQSSHQKKDLETEMSAVCWSKI